MIKQKDIAEKTGFSLTVVSRALSPIKGKNDTLSEKTRLCIREVAEKMGYKLNYQASCLRKGKLPAIGIFLPAWKGALMSELIMGISDAAINCGIPLSFYFDMTEKSYGNFIDSMQDQGNSGILGYVPRLNDNPDKKIMEKLYDYNSKYGNVVLLNTLCYQQHDLLNVSIDEKEGGRLAAQYLKERNCSRFIAVHYAANIYLSRISGFTEGIAADSNRKFYPLPGPAENEYPDLNRIAAEIFESLKPGERTGIFAVTDMIANYLLFNAMKNGLEPGKDFYIVSYDWDLKNPHDNVSSIIQPFYDIGFRGFMKLFNSIKGGKEENEIIKPRLEPA